ncbi:MAG: LytR C-terminal domain-containing protein [Ilumatobacteraceae bacterium]
MLSRRLSVMSMTAIAAVVATALTGCTFGPDATKSTTTTSSSTTSTSTSTTTTIPPTTSTSTTSTTTTTTIPPTTTTTTIPLITEGAVVIVANASGVTGAAALLTQELTAAGFHMMGATNSAGVEEKLDGTKVYFLPAGTDVAASIGRALGGIPVTPMPTPVSITGGPARLGDATVVVMLGKDIANNKPILPAP